MEVSQLQVKVTSEGVDKVSRQLGGLGKSAENADTKVSKLTDTITKLIGMQGKLGTVQQAATSQAQSQAQAFGNLHTVMGQIAQNLNGFTGATNALALAMQNLNSHTNNVAGALQRKSHWGNVATSTLKAMATASSVYMGIGLAKNIVESADQWANMNAKLVVFTGSQRNATRAQQDIYDVSQKLRVPLADTAQLWTRLSPAMQRMGRTGEDTTRVVQSVASALQLSGATSQEASSAMLQLSQSFNAGRLNGAEFNAVAEAAPILLDAIASKMGKGREELKKLGSDGKITGKIMADALIEIGPKWDELFKHLPVTFGGAMQVLKNTWLREIGEMGKDTGFNQELIKGVQVLQSMIPGIVRGLGEAFVTTMKWIDANREKLGEIWDQVVGIGKDIWGIVEGFFKMVGLVAGAGDNVSLVASGLFGVRLVMAAIVDLVKLLAGSFVAVGADIYEFLLVPVAGVAKLLTAINETLAGMNEAAAKVSRAAGNNYYAEKQEAAAKSQRANAKAIDDFMMGAVTMGQKARDLQAELTEGWRTGNTEVQKVLDSTTKLAAAKNTNAGAYHQEDFPGKPGGKPVDEKAIKAAHIALEKYQKVFEGLVDKTHEQIELNERLKTYGLDYDKLSAGAQARIKWEAELTRLQQEGASKEKIDRAFIILQQAKELEGWEALNERRLESLRIDKAAEDLAASKNKSLAEELAQMQYKVKTFGMAKGAVEALEEAETRRQVNELSAMEILTPHQAKMLNFLQQQLILRSQLATASGELGQLETIKKLEDMLDGNKAAKFGNDMKEAFGKAGKSIGTVVDAMEKMNQRQVKTNKLRDEYAKLNKDDAKSAVLLGRIQAQELADSLDGYADLASAAKGFFDEKSKGYAAMEAAEKVFRAFQMANAIKQFVMESGFITTLTGIFVGAKATEASAETASVAANLTANTAKQAANATTAATSALAAPWPASFASFAIVVGLLAALGVGLSGGGSAPSAPSTNEGKGTVFGDSSAKSESVTKSLEAIQDLDLKALRFSAQMASSLTNIEASLVGVVSLVLRNTTGLTSGGNFGVQEGTIKNSGDPLLNATDLLGGAKWANNFIVNSGLLGHIAGAIQSAWGKTSTEIVQAGVFISGKLSDLMNGKGMSQFADVKKSSSSWFGLKKDTSYETLFAGLDPAMARQFSLVLSNIVDSVVMAGTKLGVPSAQIQAALDGLTLSIGRIDLKGLTGTQIQEKLEAVFGAAADTIAKAVIPGFDAFQKVGEGYFETVVRVATGVEAATYELDKLGIAAVNVQQVINKQGDIGAEIVRQSLLVVEAGTGIGEIIATLTGTAEEIASTYSTLAALRRAMEDVGLGNGLGIDAIRAAGGLEALQDAVAAYTEGFFSDAERRAIQTQNLTEDFAKLGVALPASRAAFRALVESLQASGNDSLATKVLLLAGAFADLDDAATEAAAQALEDARDALTTSYNKEKDAITSVKEKFDNFTDSLREFKSSLLTGELSTLTNAEKYATLKAQYDATAQAAMGGDEKAIEKFSSIAQEFLSFSREFNASGAQYVADFNAVLAVTTALEQYTSGQASVADQQLSLLEAQVAGLLEVNESVLSVAEAIANLQLLLAGQAGTQAATVAAASVDTLAVQADTQTAQDTKSQDMMISELQALRAQVASLQEQQANETVAIIATNIDANAANADTIADASNSATYTNQRLKVNIA